MSPGRRRLHTAFAALAALFIVSLYFVTSPLLSLPHSTVASTATDWTRWKTHRNSSKHSNSWSLSHSHRKPITLDTDAELAAVTNFIASLASNAIPPTVDPSKPIDPELVLGFDIRSPRALEDLQELRIDVWEKNPIIIFSEMHSPTCREAKTMFIEMNTKPGPLIFDIDQRGDARVLTPLLHRLTATTSLPIVLIGGKPVGPTITDLRSMRDSGELRKLVHEAGAELVSSQKKNKKGRK
ncbi:hypothetical protein SISSUDRAFT_982844 [Sistotremastrum suecicum HHB10207 ss-3]|uniref:Uncharacterized protein n=1 Tax=Sistotremastrum suecicum HHB10207 ss-3 TaxID=1314776 RepID=A0A166FKQ7_9AGAM|nr:hypothetical protein SISSUDRAFT_982844 [Sistotremastrum suecicum HHB10207 ss-3]